MWGRAATQSVGWTPAETLETPSQTVSRNRTGCVAFRTPAAIAATTMAIFLGVVCRLFPNGKGGGEPKFRQFVKPRGVKLGQRPTVPPNPPTRPTGHWRPESFSKAISAGASKLTQRRLRRPLKGTPSVRPRIAPRCPTRTDRAFDPCRTSDGSRWPRDSSPCSPRVC